jgi:hypothetical protein
MVDKMPLEISKFRECWTNVMKLIYELVVKDSNLKVIDDMTTATKQLKCLSEDEGIKQMTTLVVLFVKRDETLNKFNADVKSLTENVRVVMERGSLYQKQLLKLLVQSRRVDMPKIDFGDLLTVPDPDRKLSPQLEVDTICILKSNIMFILDTIEPLHSKYNKTLSKSEKDIIMEKNKLNNENFITNLNVPLNDNDKNAVRDYIRSRHAEILALAGRELEIPNLNYNF